jgi:hypothetical protein
MPPIPNYLTDSLFYGLRQLLGHNVVDIPRSDFMYEDATKECLDKTGNRGKVLYGLLKDSPDLMSKRCFWQRELNNYDLIVFADIYHNCDLFNDITRQISLNKIIIVDGYDSSAMFPYISMKGRILHKPWSFFYGVSKVKYFKREFESKAHLRGIRYNSLDPLFTRPANIRSITMSIPASHIEQVPISLKTKKFVDYIVDEEVAYKENMPEKFADLGVWRPVFNTEEAYMADIKNSLFGITTKRGGWDSLRHYEYACKGTILCFRQLDHKHQHSAPIGLDDTNCIVYEDYNDLQGKINRLSVSDLQQIQNAAYNWIKQHTSEQVAHDFICQAIEPMKSL